MPPSLRPFSSAVVVVASAATLWWITGQTGTSLFLLLTTLGCAALMFAPLGGLVTRLVLPEFTNAAVRIPLALGVGFMLTPPIVVVLGTWHHLSWYPAVCALLAAVFVYSEWRSPSVSWPQWRAQSHRGLILIMVLSLVAKSVLAWQIFAGSLVR